MGKIPLLVVAGPTASGKTALGIKLAQKFGGEIISADSMQIYRGIPIATAQPSEEELHAVPHHLIGFLELGTKFSVADYLPLAHEKAEEISKRKKLPIVVGGTGLYIDSLADDVKLNDCGSTEIRKELEEKLKANGAQYMHDMLCAVDEDSARKIDVNNTRRVIRALEVFLSTGVTITKHNELSKKDGSRYNVCYLRLDFFNREHLYERINRRVDIMMEQGLLEEAAAARPFVLENGAGQAIGHKEVYPYLDGEITKEQAVENLKTSTRRYAKRQQTWFSKRQNALPIFVDGGDVIAAAENYIKDWMKTL